MRSYLNISTPLNEERPSDQGKSHNILEAPNEPKEDAISIKIECRQIGIPLDSL